MLFKICHVLHTFYKMYLKIPGIHLLLVISNCWFGIAHRHRYQRITLVSEISGTYEGWSWNGIPILTCRTRQNLFHRDITSRRTVRSNFYLSSSPILFRFHLWNYTATVVCSSASTMSTVTERGKRREEGGREDRWGCVRGLLVSLFEN